MSVSSKITAMASGGVSSSAGSMAGSQGRMAERIDSKALGQTRKIIAAKMAITTSILLNIKTGL
jgi:hypothetical protein